MGKGFKLNQIFFFQTSFYLGKWLYFEKVDSNLHNSWWLLNEFAFSPFAWIGSVLYKNNFSGDIPKEIAGLTMLELLDVRGNNLTGTIPTEIGHMLSLKHLWVLRNFMHILMSKALKSPYQVSLSSDCFARINFKKVYRLSLESYARYLIFSMTKIFHQMRGLELVA